jgi:hypothetical protein
METVKRKKLEGELQHILRQNEEEDHVYKLQMAARKDKEVTLTLFRLSKRNG